MCKNIIDGVDVPEGALARGNCGQLCAKCRARLNADVYGAQLPYVAAPLIHPDIIGPEEERELRELMQKQIEQRHEIALREGELWLFD